MRILDIALKDLLRSFRSAFLLAMMFIAPLLLTGLIYFAFGRAEAGFDLPITRVWVANLDRPDAPSALAAGQLLTEYLQGGPLSELLRVTVAPDQVSVRAAVDQGQADVAVIIPEDLTAALRSREAKARIVLYHDPTLTVGPGIVKILVSDLVDGFAGAEIAVAVVSDRLSERGVPMVDAIVQDVTHQYVDWVQQSTGHSHEGQAAVPVLVIRQPSTTPQPTNLQTLLLGPVMAGMMVFSVFFTGAAGASSIIHEDEEGTLARLCTTPTSPAAILGGKFAAIVLTLVVQTTVLMAAARLVFAIHWGQPLPIVLLVLGLVLAAAGFGVFMMSFVKTARQSGPVMGGVLSVMGLLSGLFPTGDPSQPSVFDKVGLALPQGWAMRGWRLTLGGADAGAVLLSVAVLLAAGVVLFLIGLLGFRRRFA